MKLHKSIDLRRILPALTGLCLLLAASVSGPAQMAPVSQDSLLIGPGDQINVAYFDAPELNQGGRVADDGNFALIVGGPIHVAGLTTAQAASAIGDLMVKGNYLVNPKVIVNLTQFATQSVSVLGDVTTPGAYVISTSRTISEVLALAGGLKPDADRTIVVQRRGTGEMLTFYTANSPLTRPDSSAPGTSRTAGSQLLSREVMVNPGDTVRVAHAELVYMLGDVGKPGGFPIVNNDQSLTVLQLVSLAGGTNHTARPAKARLIRKLPDGNFQEIPLPLSDMQKGKVNDRVLQANDIIYVPFSYLRNTLLGIGGIVTSAASSTVYAVK